MKRVEILNEYYTNLDYDNKDKEKTLKEIYDLSETVRFHYSVTIPERIEKLTDIIQKNILLFKSVCRHVDEIDTILKYLTNYIKDSKMSKIDQTTVFYETLLTLFSICKESEIQSFLMFPICIDSTCDVEKVHFYIKNSLETISTEREMIILEDSDVYAVINNLIITDHFPLYKIWVQEQVKEKFLWLMKRHCSDSFTIDTFQSLKDIQFHAYDETTISIVSVWSEDIVAAKNFALTLNCHIIFINTHMDFCGGMALIPYNKMIKLARIRVKLIKIYAEKSDLTDTEQSANVIHFSHTPEVKFTSRYKLFYDGNWQEPVKGMYWKQNDNLWANATNDDIIRCYESAEKGFKTWGIKSIKTRIQILSKLVSILKLNGKPVLADIVSRWLKFPYLFPTIQGYLDQNAEMEVMQVRKPVGVIILKEKNENVLFFRLMQTLIAGNSVIVLFDTNFCNLAPHCDMFSTCGIPPGVINLLSHEDTNVLNRKLCTVKYTDYAYLLFGNDKSKERYINPYLKLTMPKNIIIRLK